MLTPPTSSHDASPLQNFIQFRAGASHELHIAIEFCSRSTKPSDHMARFLAMCGWLVAEFGTLGSTIVTHMRSYWGPDTPFFHWGHGSHSPVDILLSKPTSNNGDEAANKALKQANDELVDELRIKKVSTLTVVKTVLRSLEQVSVDQRAKPIGRHKLLDAAGNRQVVYICARVDQLVLTPPESIAAQMDNVSLFYFVGNNDLSKNGASRVIYFHKHTYQSVLLTVSPLLCPPLVRSFNIFFRRSIWFNPKIEYVKKYPPFFFVPHQQLALCVGSFAAASCTSRSSCLR